MTGGKDPQEYTPRAFASEVLQRYDRGQWSSPLDMMSHMAAALRLLLEATCTPGGEK